MIYGIGTDIIRIARIEAVLMGHGERFAERILGDDELLVFRRRRDRSQARGVRYLATRFAAKEAFSKALGLDMRMPMTWRLMQTLNVRGGKPVVMVSGPLKDYMDQNHLQAQVSITDEA